MSSDKTKQICLWMIIYTHIYIYIYIRLLFSINLSASVLNYQSPSPQYHHIYLSITVPSYLTIRKYIYPSIPVSINFFNLSLFQTIYISFLAFSNISISTSLYIYIYITSLEICLSIDLSLLPSIKVYFYLSQFL